MQEIAFRFEQSIKSKIGIAGTAITIITFKDDSQLQFEISGKPNPKIVGGKESMAHEFATSVKSFKPLETGYEIVFQDNSKVSYNLGNAIKKKESNPKM